MSKLMEIRIKLVPVYGAGGLPACLPNLAKSLKDCGYEKVLSEEPTLYKLVDVLVRLKNDPATPANIKKPITKMLDQIRKVHDQAREQLLARHLNELDQTLYQLEDLFDDLERELSW